MHFIIQLNINSIDVKISLLQNNWFDVFALGLSQWTNIISLNSLLTNINIQIQTNLHQGKISHRNSLIMNEQLFYLQNFINECHLLEITQMEYAYLKLISIFDSGNFIFFYLYIN